MYRRVSYMQMKKKKARRKRMIKAWCALIMAACIGGTSLALAVNAWAAPEDASAEEAAELNVQQEEAGETISGNVALPETGEEREKKEEGKLAVIIDPGHGGEDEGCAKEGVREKDVNLAIAKLVRDKLNGMGYQVIMTREEDAYIAKEERVENANASNADIYVSIHQNTFEDGAVEGIETWYDGSDSVRDSKRLAQLIHQETINTTGAVQRQIRDDAQLHVTGKTVMPACLIETGFLSNPGEREKLVSPEYQEQIAEGIVRGIDLYFHPKTMYLTFDDGPYVENTARVLDVLKARGIKATFFL